MKKDGLMSIPQVIASSFNANLLAGMLCRFFNVKTKFLGRASAFLQSHSCDSYSNGGKPPKMLPFMSEITVRLLHDRDIGGEIVVV
jgi:hypothetical protein